MGALVLSIHSQTPELKKIRQVADALRDGAVVLYPTDTAFSLSCALSNKEGISRIRSIRRFSENKELTFLCPDLANIAQFAKVTNQAYKVIKRLIPGPFTFILPASKLVPKLAQNPKRKTAGIRVPDNNLSQLLLRELESPIISITAKKEDGSYFDSHDNMMKTMAHFVDIEVQSDKYAFVGQSTIVDMTTDDYSFIRKGAEFEKVAEYIGIEV